MKKALFFLAVAVLGVVLYIVAHDHATELRGYVAYGGEVFFLALPLYGTYKAVCSIAEHFIYRKER